MKILEKDMEDLIIANPDKYLGEPGLKLLSRQYSIGSYRFDLLFEDRHGGKLIVELQRGTLDRNHTYKILDYYDEYKIGNPGEFVDLMVVANKIKRERRTRLEFHGIQYKEIPTHIFQDEISQNSSIEKPQEKNLHENIINRSEVENGKEVFDRLILRKNWMDECAKKVEMTVHRQEQLVDILSKFDGFKIPFTHFKNEYINDGKLSNAEIYPVVCAYHIGYFDITEKDLILKEMFKEKFSKYHIEKYKEARKEMRDNKAIYTRLLEIMGVGYSLGEHPTGGTYIEFPGNGFNRICLYEYEKAPQNTFSLAIFSGDTCAQARELFKHFSNAKVIDLEKGGWTVKSSFHFAWQRKNILSTKGHKSMALSEYVEYWRWALGERYIRKYNKNEFDLLLKRMRDANVMDNSDIAEFNEYFRTHKYQSAITCPGITNWISYSKDRLNEDIEILAAELKEKMISLNEIYSQN